MSSDLVTVTAQIPAADVELLDRFAAAARFPRRSRAASVRYLIEASRPMLEHVIDLAEAANDAPSRLRSGIETFAEQMDAQIEEARELLDDFRNRPPTLRAVEPPPSNRGVTP